ncbi:MAG TPA: GlxA family transcriptional regulator [Chthoniobacterales bacterium]
MPQSSLMRRVAILTVPPVFELDLVEIVNVFSLANDMVPSGRGYRIEVFTLDERGQTGGMYGLQFTGGRHYSALKGNVDTFLVPGGLGSRTVSLKAPLLKWLRQKAANTRRFGSVCTGAFFLAEAGLLDGRRATTHWAFAQDFAHRYPKVKLDPRPIWIRDGNIYTSAGITSGIDLCLALVEEDHGSKIALEVARMLVVFLRRPGNQAQFSVSLAGQSAEHRPLQDLRVWMAENLKADLSVSQLATRVSMSPRNFQRVFTKEIGEAPARYVEVLRVEAARRKLEHTTQSLDEIADHCGFSSAHTLVRCFRRQLETTPGEYRSRFGPTGARPSISGAQP